MLLIFMAYEQIYIPMQLAFAVPKDSSGAFRLPAIQLVIQLMIDLCFIADIVIRFRTTVTGRAEEGYPLITDTKARSHCRRAAPSP